MAAPAPAAAVTPAVEPTLHHAALHSSPSTALLSGTMLVQSPAAATGAPAAGAAASSPSKSLPARAGSNPAVEYKGATSEGGGKDATANVEHNSAQGRATRRAQKGQSKEELRAAFSVFDTDGDGSITTAEFTVVFRMLSGAVSDTELNEMISELDANGDGDITFDEFAAMMSRRAQAELDGIQDPIDDALQVFDTADLSVTRMSQQELAHICTLLKENLTEEEMESVVKEMQVDADGQINYARLVQQMMPGS